MEIAGGRQPRSSLAAPPRLLFARDQPIAFADRWLGKDVGVGRAGALDGPDAAQKSDPAARSESEPSGPMSR
jgi:hypothetical protein